MDIPVIMMINGTRHPNRSLEISRVVVRRRCEHDIILILFAVVQQLEPVDFVAGVGHFWCGLLVGSLVVWMFSGGGETMPWSKWSL